MKEVLSVIVPVYNSQAFVSRCVKSILRQTYTKFQVLIIDDGSTDDSYRICAQFANEDRRVKLVHQEHKGIAYTRKAAIDIVNSEYVIFVDSDDWIERDFLEMAVDSLDSEDAIVVGYYLDNERNLNIPSVSEGIYMGKDLEIIWRSLFSTSFADGITGVLWDKILKTSLVKRAANYIPDGLYMSEDRCIEMYVLLFAERVKVLNIGGYHYCGNKDSITHSVHKDHLFNEHLYYQTMLEIMKPHSLKEELLKALDRHIVTRLPMTINMLGIEMDEFWYYPYYGRLPSARIILYGAGKVGRSYYRSLLKDQESVIVAWVDKDYVTYKEKGLDVVSPDCIDSLKYDYIIIAVSNEKIARVIRKELMCIGVSGDCILWNKTKCGIL